MKSRGASVIRRRAIRLEQMPNHPLYLFTLTGQELQEIAEISRVSRDDAGKLIGYQRSEVKQHVNSIVEYLDSGDILFPNSIILALSSRIVFKQSRGPKVDDEGAPSGTLEIPLPRPGQPKPAWIVDGQQRAVALSKSKRQALLVPISGFVADEIDIQRDQFLRVNSTKPLPRGLINELLPEVGTALPANLAAKKVPSALCDLLNRDPASPFCGLVIRASMDATQKKKAVVADSSLQQMIQHSFGSSGCLFGYRNTVTGETDFATVRALLLLYWGAVKEVFSDAWGLPAKQSRLMHGVGILAMGRLMDHIMAAIDLRHERAAALVTNELLKIRPYCRWTKGEWEELNMGWNELQDVRNHIQMLSNFLIRAYLQSREVKA